MNRKTFAILYMLISSIVNIIYTLLVCAIVIVVSMILMKYAFHARAELYGPALSALFILGLVIAFITYSKISMKVIKKYKFDERFSSPAPKKKGTDKAEPKKTVLPSSVVEDEEDEKWKE